MGLDGFTPGFKPYNCPSRLTREKFLPLSRRPTASCCTYVPRLPPSPLVVASLRGKASERRDVRLTQKTVYRATLMNFTRGESGNTGDAPMRYVHTFRFVSIRGNASHEESCLGTPLSAWNIFHTKDHSTKKINCITPRTFENKYVIWNIVICLYRV